MLFRDSRALDMLARPFVALRHEPEAVTERPRPYVALLAGILLPGLGHWYAGRKRDALVSFAAVTACFGVGWAMSGYRIFAFTSPFFAFVGRPLLEWIPIHLLPEAGNFAQTTFAWLLQPAMGPLRARELHLPVAGEHLGLTLAGLSGYLNCILAADACWLVARQNLEAERGRSFPGRPALSVLWGWLVPGLGHVREGRRAIGLLVGASILLLYAMGLYFSELRGVDRAQLYWWWAAQGGAGGPTLLATPLLGPLMIEHEIPTMNLGVTLLTLAGLLNVVALTDVYSVGEKRALAPAARTEATPA